MRQRVPCSVRAGAVLLVTLLLVPVAGADWKQNIQFMFGPKTLDEDFEPAEDQIQFGASFTFGDSGWPIMLAVDVTTSSGDGTGTFSYYYYPYYYDYFVDADVKTTEIAVGVRKEFGSKKVHPFLGGGLEWSMADANFTDVTVPGSPLVLLDDSDSDIGYWLNAGVYWDLGENFNLGLNIRYSDAEATLNDASGTPFDLDASSLHYGILAGWRW